ncbi:MAG: hypothetical protein WC865_10255 [Bacteroidales bacterium]
MKIDIVGEDDVTRAIIERLIEEYRPDLIIDKVLPARGGHIKPLAVKYNLVNSPIMLLTDLDTYDCPPSLIHDWFGPSILNPKYLFRIAYGEGESWLMADRVGFSAWIHSDIHLIPPTTIIDKRRNIFEIVFPYKPSLYLMREIASASRNIEMRTNFSPRTGAKRGPLYNSTLLPFIRSTWNIVNAARNSTSLSKTIQRLLEFSPDNP